MPDNAGPEPASHQVVSDFGQLRAFNDSLNIRILRILQRQEATTEQLFSLVDSENETISERLEMLLGLRLIKVVNEDDSTGRTYRATALIYDLQPDPADNAEVMARVASATLASIQHDVMMSLIEWPDQRMNFESRRLQMSRARAQEFNERWIELLAEFWGDPEHPVEDDPNEPVMAFAGLWYRFPDQG